ncbi:MAG: hypothetical protein NC408_03270 [Candidatus Gastranaerophilales bacterium]|nr:hypothetical protein [Candidatus Gastranaerophilales bacterium]MCM1073194.1 hypothetical protein [Bacteroides sp.]
MQINRIESPNFGQVKINKSAHKVLETLSDKSITEMFEKASRIQDTKRWDLHINGHNNNEFFMYFIDKQNKLENSFCGGLYPYARIGKTVSAIGLDAKANSDENIFYSLKFATEQRAQEVCDMLNQPLPENNMDIFRRAVETIKILEESNNYIETASTESQKTGFFDKFLSFIGLKK